jgi:drug/metabolite transporter (DMT)-like permease
MATNSSTFIGYGLTLVVVTAFAFYPSIVPLGLAAGCSPFGFVLAAMLVSLIGMTTLAMLRGVKITPEVSEAGSRIMLGTLFFLEHACLLFALTYLKVPVAMSLIYTYPFLIALVRVVQGSHAASPVLFVSLMLCLLGIALVLGFSADQIDSTGISIAIMQAGLAASRVLLASRLAQSADGLALAVQMFGVGVILGGVTSPLVSIVLPHTANAWFAIIAAGLSGIVGHTCLMWALQRIGAVPFGVIMNLEPVVAAILVAVIAGQLLTPPQYAGALLVVASVTMYSFAEKRNKMGV